MDLNTSRDHLNPSLQLSQFETDYESDCDYEYERTDAEKDLNDPYVPFRLECLNDVFREFYGLFSD